MAKSSARLGPFGGGGRRIEERAGKFEKFPENDGVGFNDDPLDSKTDGGFKLLRRRPRPTEVTEID